MLLLVLIAGSIFSGYARGLLVMLVGVVGYVVSIWVAGHYAQPVLDWLNKAHNLTGRFATSLNGHVPIPPELYHVPASALSPERAMVLLRALPVPEVYREHLVHNLATQAVGSVSLGEWLLRQFAAGILEGVCFLIISVLVGSLLFSVAVRVSRILSHVPLIGFLNRLGGAAIGGVESIVSLALLLGFLSPVMGFSDLSSMAGAVQHSAVANWLLSLNPSISHLLFGRGWLFLTI